MFSKSLFKQSIKSNWVIWTAITAVMTVLCVQFSALEMTQNLLFTIFYGMMTTILPSIYVLVTANKLIASQVDRGSMAYVLSTPVKRQTVIITQMTFLILSLALMFGITTLAHIAVNTATPLTLATAMGNASLPIKGNLTTQMIFEVNLSAFVCCVALAAVCFMFSEIFNLSKYSIGLSGTFIGVNILANMLAMFGKLGVDGLKNFKYLTICSFYDANSVLLQNNDWVEKMIFPLVIALVAFIIGGIIFKKKDLPL